LLNYGNDSVLTVGDTFDNASHKPGTGVISLAVSRDSQSIQIYISNSKHAIRCLLSELVLWPYRPLAVGMGSCQGGVGQGGANSIFADVAVFIPIDFEYIFW